MKLFRKYPLFFKGMSLFLVFTLLGEIFYPTYASALTAGPDSPEFSSFEPVSTTDMVDPFTGDFTYNLPVLSVPGTDGGGYAMSLSYHSGGNSEEEASWVGFGWTLNAGAINRSKVGFPDEFKDVTVKRYSKIVPNWTVSAVENINLEIYSDDSVEAKKNTKAQNKKLKEANLPTLPIPAGETNLNLNYTQSVRYNNYSGLMKSHGYSASFKGMASLNMNFAGGNATFGFSIHPMGILKNKLLKDIKNAEKAAKIADSCIKDRFENQIIEKRAKLEKLNKLGYHFKPSIGMNPNTQYPGVSVARTIGKSFNFSASIAGEFMAAGFEVGYSGNTTINVTRPIQEMKANGFLNYSEWKDEYDGEDNTDRVHDYFIENESNFKKTDKTLGIPFGGADAFIVTGEGIGGGFHFRHSKIPVFHPNKVTNEETISNIGVEFGFGQTIALGLDVGAGWHRTVVDNWQAKKRENLEKNIYKEDTENSFLQFINDPGTALRYTKSNTVLSGSFEGFANKDLKMSEFENYFHDDSGGLDYSDYGEMKQGGSSFIEYHLNSVPLNDRFDKLIETGQLNSSGGSHLREIRITKPDGTKHVYGIPLLAQNEKSLTVGLSNGTGFNSELENPEYKVFNSNVYSEGNSIFEKNMTVVGDETSTAYSNSFLLTQIVSPDYLDVNDNGPDANDYGGWTKFTYWKKYSVSGNTYKHRAPYTGLLYDSGRLNNPKDQTGSFSMGEKEVAYLKTIETKTHIACFVTNTSSSVNFETVADGMDLTGVERTNFLSQLNGSQASRLDGVDAKKPDSNGLDGASSSENAVGSNRLEYLERIVLFAKSRPSQPLSQTHFEYSYELCKGIPNNVQVGSTLFDNKGKLTLKKVWTDTEGIVKAKVSPYQFEYNYFTDYTGEAATRASSFIGSISNLIENPDYKEGYLDAWGNYQDFEISKSQRLNRRPWIHQGELPNTFDPAAWSLKRIILPSGGEIHVNYESKDYTHVQDKLASALVSIDPYTIENASYPNAPNQLRLNKFYLNLNDVNLKPLETIEIRKYFNKLSEEFFGIIPNSSDTIVMNSDETGSKKLMYFKFYVNYKGAPSFKQATNDDEIDGYVPIHDIGINNQNKIYIRFGGTEKLKKLTPWHIAVEHARSMGNWGMDFKNNLDADYSIDGNLIEKAYGLSGIPSNQTYDIYLNNIKTFLLKDKDLRKKMGTSTVKWIEPERVKICPNYSLEKSFLKVPIPNAKRGGGARVKRLLMYNPGIETGEESLYGSEYIYERENGESSGVATYEPAGMRAENPLVDILPKYKQSVVNKLLAGKDKSWAEGPLGEHLYPAPSVGHTRVVIKNIHSGKSSSGFVVNSYHTCKDFPTVSVLHTELKKPKIINSDGSKNDREYYRKSKFSVPLGMINYAQDKAWLAQGYKFEISDRHGLLASSYTYGGSYEAYKANPASASIYASVQNFYSNMPVTTIAGDHSSGELVLTKSQKDLGIEEDITMYAARVEDRTFDFALELDLNIFLQTTPTCSMGFGLSLSYNETELSQHVTSRVFRRTSKLVSTITYADGIRTLNETLAYNDLDGSPILTRVSTAFDSKEFGNNREFVSNANYIKDAYYSLDLPAAWRYTKMGKKSIDQNNFNLLGASMGSITTHNVNPLDMFSGTETWNIHENPIPGVVSASATEFKQNRFDDEIDYFLLNNQNQIQAEISQMDIIKEEFKMNSSSSFDGADLATMNNFYYPTNSYTFIGDRTSANESGTKIYNGGILKDFDMFNWGTSSVAPTFSSNPKWKSPAQVTKFSPNGQALEEVDLLGIYSSVHLGYNYLLPVMSASNAKYESTLFEHFEESIGSAGYSPIAHSGKRSLVFGTTTHNVLSPKKIKWDNQLEAKGGVCKMWVRLTNPTSNDPLLTEVADILPAISINGQNFQLKVIAKVEDWVLLETEINQWGGIAIGDKFNLKLIVQNLGSQKLEIDDVCFHPTEAAVSMKVYDSKDFRVMAELSDQHFATFYEYNTQGQLVRTVIETEKGRKTVKEQQSNSPKVNR